MLKIYKASAGSGKTYTLAYEYIRTLLAVKDPASGLYRLNHPVNHIPTAEASNRHRHILAITFTNKATEEMKRRIIDELDALASTPPPGADDANYAAALCGELRCTRRQLAESADKAMHELLCDYNQFNVTTIDSFFQRVLRTFARELDRQGDFSVELNDVQAIKLAVECMLDDYNKDHNSNPMLGLWLYDYITSRIDDGLKANFFNRRSKVHNDLVELAAKICNEQFKQYSRPMRAFLGIDRHDPDQQPASRVIDLTRKINTLIDGIRPTLHDAATDAVKRLNDDGVDLDQLNGRSNIAKIINTLLQGNMPAKKDITDTVRKIANGESSPWTKSRFTGNDTHTRIVSDLLETIVRLMTLCSDYHTTLDALNQLGLIGYAWRYLDELNQANNIVLLSDTNHMLSRIISKDDAPFIYERIGMEINSFLIDEFQDTSRLQWDNLRPLVDNGLSTGADSLIIGDEKQSIYRFRNSDSSLLHTRVADVDFPAPRYDTRVHGSAAGENTNYRSAADVVRFNNTLFTHLASIYNVEGYENVIQDIPARSKDKPAYIHFVPPVTKESDDDNAEPPTGLDLMAADILRQHNEGKYRWSDIVVLVNTNANAATVVEHLINNYPEISIVSDEALYLKKSHAIQTIVGYLELYANNIITDKTHSDGSNKYPTQAEIAVMVSRFHYYRRQGCDDYTSIDKAVNDDSPDNSVSQSVADIKGHHPSTLIALVETIIHEQITAAERRSQYAYIAAFQDYIQDYCERYNPSVRAFLDHWAVAKDKVAVQAAADIDAVRVMTIHKAKGLEFACVHIPIGSWKETKPTYSDWIAFPTLPGLEDTPTPPAIYATISAKQSPVGSVFHSDYERINNENIVDCLNKTYVAYTRASAELIVHYDPKSGIGKSLVKAFAMPTVQGTAATTLELPAYYDSDTHEFVLGEPTVNAKATDAPRTDTADHTYEVYINSGADIYTHLSDMLDMDTDITEDDDDSHTPGEYIDETSRQRGLMLHDILSAMLTADDASSAIARVAAAKRLDKNGRDELREIIDRMLGNKHPGVARWFDPAARILTEQAIYLPDRGHERRIDRLVYNPDGSIDIVDYKFTSERQPKHRRQVNDYIDILRSMGNNRVRGYLWYPLIDGSPIIEI